MIAVLIFVIALATLAQFSISWWRAMLARVAEEPVSAQGRQAAEICASSPADPAAFPALLGLHESCPELDGGCDHLLLVRAYYGLMKSLEKLLSLAAPSAAEWARSEMALCTQYATVRIDQRLASISAVWSEMRSH
jgi:hypothetical protein